MILIREGVQQVMATGYLGVRAEDQLRLLLKTKSDSEELNTRMTLQLLKNAFSRNPLILKAYTEVEVV